MAEQTEEHTLFTITGGPDRHAFLRTLSARNNSFEQRPGFDVTFQVNGREERARVSVAVCSINRVLVPDTDDGVAFMFLARLEFAASERYVKGSYDSRHRQGWMEEISLEQFLRLFRLQPPA